MPTNKLWIEHTERAAWESVSALRAELAEAKRRVERLTPPVEGWSSLTAALDALKEEHALGGRTYAEIVRGVVDRLDLIEHRLRAAQEELTRLRAPSPPSHSATNIRSLRESGPPTAEEARRFELVAKRFVRAMQRRHSTMTEGELPATVDDLFGTLAAKVDELGGMDEGELADASVEVAVLALCLHNEAIKGT